MVEIGHPAHVHLFKNMIWKLEKHGSKVKIVAKDKDVTLELLRAYGFKYELLGKNYNGVLNKAYGLIKMDYRLFKVAKKFKPDLFVSRGSPYTAHVSRLLTGPHIAFCDSERAALIDMLAYPFTDVICTPSCFKKRLNPKKHVMFNGYKELAYLHPNNFKPNPAILEELNLGKDDNFVILRFVAWQASHDIGLSGFDLETKQKLVKEIEKHAQVFITTESKLPGEFEKYRITIPPHKIHDLLYHALLFVGDGQTMTTEAGILGTPAIRCNSFVGKNDMGNFIELENKYGLIYSYRDSDKALNKALELLKTDNLKREWQIKREKLLNEKIDVTKFMVEFIEGYPQSFQELIQSQKNHEISQD